MDKSAIRNFAIEARKMLMKSAETEAGFYGVTKNGCKSPIQKGNDFEVYETIAGTENRIYGADIKRRANLVKAVETLGFEQVIEETAYTWFNRIIAIRFMEVNDYLPTRVRVLSSETGSNTPDIVTQSLDVDLNMTPEELEKVQKAKDENRYDDAFRILFIKQCNELNAILPGLFEKTDDYMELLLKLSYTSDGVVRMLVDSIDENNFNVETEGQVEIIGWMYQYYNTELKDDTFAKLKKNIKITKERIPAATQLFTPDWIVRYMVENSVGRVWIEHLKAINPSISEKEKAEEFGWDYYLPQAEQTEEVLQKFTDIRKDYLSLKPEDISCIDPCMGSGHILVYMFDVLLNIYVSEGYSERDAAFLILENNINGLDIDRRAYQLSYFALMMKARGYNRLFFRGKNNEAGERVIVSPQVFVIEESNEVNRNQIQYLGATLSEIEKNNAVNQLNGLLDELKNAKEFGSILKVTKCDWKLLEEFVTNDTTDGQMSLDSIYIEETKRKLLYLVKLGKCLADKYMSVVTNPPYMGSKGMSPCLQEFVQKEYIEGKYDLFAAFILRCIDMTKANYFACLVTMQSWMFLSSFEELRYKLESIVSLESLLHMGNMVMGIAFGTSSFVYRKCNIANMKSNFDFVAIGDIEAGQPIAFPTKGRRNVVETVTAFDVIPGRPLAYWAGEKMLEHFTTAPKLSDVCDLKQGLITADNDRFIRFWQEVEWHKLGIDKNNIDEFVASKCKWLPYTKGGDYRKWYGNNALVVNWENDGFEIKNFKDSKGKVLSRPQNIQYFMREGGSWSIITNGNFSMRYTPYGYGFDARGSMMFTSSQNIKYAIALLCSNVGAAYLEFLSPTVSFEVGNLSKVPYICDEHVDKIVALADKCIAICREDWNSRETSWDFKTHQLIMHKVSGRMADAYEKWSEYCRGQVQLLKQYEEEINKIFIDVYGLNGRVDYKVDDKKLSISENTREEDVKSFISYAVGCMFGRYSLDNEGICSAGKYNAEQYTTYKPDTDGVIPISDSEYFGDDVVCRFIEFVEAVYGRELLDDNLEFIADSLGTKGSTCREKIRNYFISEFYADHCNRYSVTGMGKRPIYWMFDSGKQNGFKCLIYMHRYNKDTLNLIRSEYLHKTEDAVENALKNAEYIIQTSSSAVERAKATKDKDRYVKQLNEMRIYYQALSHLALQKIEIDLDDGVKHNYQLFQGIEVIADGGKKQKVDLLAKI